MQFHKCNKNNHSKTNKKYAVTQSQMQEINITNNQKVKIDLTLPVISMTKIMMQN